MAEDSGNLWSTARRATVTAIVGGLIALVSGWLPAVWEGIQVAAASTWGLLSLSVPVPLAILAILVLPIIIWIGGAARQAFSQETPAVPQEHAEPPLDELERKILQLLAHADGRYVNFDDAADRMQVSRLVLERGCEALHQRGFIEQRQDILHGPKIGLTRMGRDFVIEQGFQLGR